MPFFHDNKSEIISIPFKDLNALIKYHFKYVKTELKIQEFLKLMKILKKILTKIKKKLKQTMKMK